MRTRASRGAQQPAPDPGASMTFNLADLFEAVADAIPDRTAVVVGDQRRLTYGELDERANRLAHHLSASGIGPGRPRRPPADQRHRVPGGAMLAAFKLRAVPVNVNYRYVEGELRYLFEDAELIALSTTAVRPRGRRGRAGRSPALQTLLHVEDGSDDAPVGRVDRVRVRAGRGVRRPARRRGRSSDDLYIVYTGGTTGMPKGVVWRHEDIFKAAMGGGDITQSGNYVAGPEELAERVRDQPGPGRPGHAAADALERALAGVPRDVHRRHARAGPARARSTRPTIWELVTREKVFILVIVGDAMARPLLDELEANRDRYDAASLWVIGSRRRDPVRGARRSGCSRCCPTG